MPRLLHQLAGTLVLFSAAWAANPGTRTEYVGGTLGGVPAKSNARLDLSSPDHLVLWCGKTRLEVDYRKVNTIEYGQNVSRRYAAAVIISPLLLLSKSRKHFITLGYVDGDGRQQALVLRVDKGDIRSVLSSLEARTGRRVEYQDEDARKSRRG
jgi:hypothetical protein